MLEGTLAGLKKLNDGGTQIIEVCDLRAEPDADAHRQHTDVKAGREGFRSNLLQINTRPYQHLVWRVLVISFSLLSVSVLRTSD